MEQYGEICQQIKANWALVRFLCGAVWGHKGQSVPSHGRGRRFNPYSAHHENPMATRVLRHRCDTRSFACARPGFSRLSHSSDLCHELGGGDRAQSLRSFFFANDGSERRRGALILLALALPMLWSRLLFQFFARPLLELDATMVTWLLGTERIGNLVRFGDNSGYMVITPACTSFGNLSYAFLCWVAITQWANHRWSSKDLLWSSLACGSVIAVNVARMALTGISYGHYQTIHHNQWREMVLSTVYLCLIIGFSVVGARRELFARA